MQELLWHSAGVVIKCTKNKAGFKLDARDGPAIDIYTVGFVLYFRIGFHLLIGPAQHYINVVYDQAVSRLKNCI